jgi:hypothetical protein
MGWNQGTKQITSFINREGKAVDIIKNYGQINEATLKQQCEQFCKPGEADAQSCTKQNNTMMCACLSKTLTADAKTKLLAHHSDFTFDGVEYAPLMYKVIMRLATMDSVATTQSLKDNLQNLGTFAVTVKGDIDKNHTEFDKNYSQLLSCGASVNNPIQILFDAYQVVPCYNFQTYIGHQYEDYLDGKLTLTHEVLLKMAKTKYDWLVSKKYWGAKSPDNEIIVAMAAKIKSLKGQLKLNPKLAEITDKKEEDKKSGKKTQNKKDTSNKREQKRRTKPGRRSHPKVVIPRRRNKGTTPTIGANTTWHGWFTSSLTAALARSTRRNKSRPSVPTLRPWQLPPPLPSILTMWPCWPLLECSQTMNDGACRHG